MYVMNQPTRWEDYLHLVEFAYKNGQRVALGMSPFEALYRRKCRPPANWDGMVNRVIAWLDMLTKMEQEVVLKTT